MAAAMMAVALGLSAAMSFRSAMAAAVIDGLITSTALRLVVTPVALTYVASVEDRPKRVLRLRRHVHPQPPSAVAAPILR